MGKLSRTPERMLNRRGGRTTHHLLGWLALVMMGCGPGHALASRDAAEEALSQQAEYGTALALRGEMKAAVSVFESMLSMAPRDPRALTGLGNLAILRGQTGAARVFYNQAEAIEPTDPGIRLNQAIIRLLENDEPGFRRRISQVALDVGGGGQVLALLGLQAADVGAGGKGGGDIIPLSEEDLRLALERVLRSLRADSTNVAADSAKAHESTPTDSPQLHGAANSGSPNSATAPTGDKNKPVPSAAGPPLQDVRFGVTRGLERTDKGLHIEMTRLLYWKQ